MTKIRIAILAAVVFVVGAAVGAYAGFRYTSSILGGMMGFSGATTSVANASTHIMTLKRLRDSNPEGAVEFLESMLDADLMSIGAYRSEYLPDSTSKVLRLASEYRAKYPRKSADPEVDAAVQRALATSKK